jgi:hypothetical protein
MKKMAKKIWSRETALAILGEMVYLDVRVIYLNGKATLTQCSAADYLANNHHFILA